MNKLKTFFLLIFFVVAATGIIAQRGKQVPLSISGYYAGSTTAVDSFPINKLNYLIFSFCHLKGNRLSVDRAADTATIQKMVSLKQAIPGLKIILSLGGWGGCKDCSPVFSTRKGRKEFAESTKELMEYFNTDGIDLDWEYPVIAGYPGHPYSLDDKENFTSLIKMLRRKLGEKFEISFAAGGFSSFIDSAIEWKKVMHRADKVNLMSYDLVHGFSKISGHHTPLFSAQQQLESVDNGVTKLLNAGVPSNKIVIGAAFYARFFEVADTLNNGLYRPAVFHHGVSYRYIYDSLTTENGFVKYMDSAAQAPYAFNAARKILVTYDDSVSIKLKTNYVRKRKLNGIMFWQIMDDKFSDGLLEVIYRSKLREESN